MATMAPIELEIFWLPLLPPIYAVTNAPCGGGGYTGDKRPLTGVINIVWGPATLGCGKRAACLIRHLERRGTTGWGPRRRRPHCGRRLVTRYCPGRIERNLFKASGQLIVVVHRVRHKASTQCWRQEKALRGAFFFCYLC